MEVHCRAPLHCIMPLLSQRLPHHGLGRHTLSTMMNSVGDQSWKLESWTLNNASGDHGWSSLGPEIAKQMEDRGPTYMVQSFTRTPVAILTQLRPSNLQPT